MRLPLRLTLRAVSAEPFTLPSWRCWLGAAAVLLLLLSGPAHGLLAQGPPPPCVSGCIPNYQVTVTPDNGTETGRTSYTSGYTTTFSVWNSGLVADTFDLTCAVTGGTCSASPAQVFLTSGHTITMTATYSTGAPQIGTVWAQAASTMDNSADVGTRSVTITGPGMPVLSHSATEVRYRDMGKCVESCLHMVYARSTVSYFSMGSAQNATLVYNSATHKPIVMVGVDITAANAQTTTPTSYTMVVRKLGVPTPLTLLNNATSASFTPAGSPSAVATRLTAALDAQANGLNTGAWPLTVIVTANYAASSFTDSLTQIAVVNDQSGSVFGAGVSLSGYQRMVFTNGRKAILEGDGSIADYGPAPFSTPAGATSTLTYNGSTTYTRRYRDGSVVEFNNNGRMTRVLDRFGSVVRSYGYFAAPNDSLISVITDQMGKSIYPCYNNPAVCAGSGNGKLSMIRLLTGAGVERIHYYAMDASNRLIRVQDPDGLSDSLAYDATTGLLNRVYDRARNATDVTYDALRRRASVQLPLISLHDGTSARPTMTTTAGKLTLWQPAVSGLIGAPKAGLKGDTVSTLIRDPLNAATRFTTDRFGGPTKVWNPYNAITTITRDAAGRPITITEPNGHYTTLLYNAFSQLISQTDGPNGRTITYSYRNTGTDDVAYIGGNVVRTDYIYYDSTGGGPIGALKKIYVGNTAGIAYPGIDSGRVVEWHKPDNLGRDTAVVDSLGHGTHVQYEATWGNTWKVTDAAGLTTRFTYDVVGRPDSTITPLAARTKVTYGSMNQVLSQVWSGTPGYKVTTTYDSLLQAVRVATPRPGGGTAPVVYKYGYNKVGALVAAFGAADTTRADSTKYDVAGNVRVVKNRNSKSVTMTYDKLGRLLVRSGPDFPTDHFAYDTVYGNWSVASNGNGYDSLQLDSRGNQVWHTTVLNGKTYYTYLTYDANDRVVKRKIVSLTPSDSAIVKFVYANTTGVRDSVCVFTPLKCVTFLRKPDFVRDTLVFNRGSGSQWKLTTGSDAAHRTILEDYQAPGSMLGAPIDAFDQSQSFDSLGRVRLRTSTWPLAYNRRVFSYDSLGRLVNACDSTGAQCQNVVNLGTTGNAWSYDSAGNRAQVGTPSGYGAGNRLTGFGGTNPTYDSIGSMVCRLIGACPGGTGVGYKYGWDALGRLREIRNGSTGALVDSMYYDALGRRVGKKMASGTEWYLYEGDQVIWDLNASGARLREYAWYPGETDKLLAMKSGTTVGAALLDPQNGSVRGLVDFSSGGIIKNYPETPWGDNVADTGITVRYRFAGREFDQENGLYYMRARYYDPALGRWISEDPIGIGGGGNLYAYAGNDPVNKTDPSGLVTYCILPDGTRGVEDPATGKCKPVELPGIGVTVPPPPSPPVGCGSSCGGGFFGGDQNDGVGPGPLPGSAPPTNANKGERPTDKPASRVEALVRKVEMTRLRLAVCGYVGFRQTEDDWTNFRGWNFAGKAGVAGAVSLHEYIRGGGTMISGAKAFSKGVASAVVADIGSNVISCFGDLSSSGESNQPGIPAPPDGGA